ncbi:ANR family transcriptional regulator [Photobacterium damselae subsp. damselae]|uniref:ANR family transcriptional regulator n=1 Tax=Photobacterium damselae TaxID=38293 RepID=UPI001F23B688|nr:ANR family transcriptional regulator [Photobacterium damselae]UKA23349.1 ANR family transcriptional regulator [Photobacterium damselae subsp. damselae]
MKECDKYMIVANKAVDAEKQQEFKLASEYWVKASNYAKCAANKHWAESRSEYCNSTRKLLN